MASNKTVWPITRHYLKNKANHLFQGDQASAEARDYCVTFSTWYLAVSDRASQSAIESMQSVADLAARVGVAYEPPSVNVFKLAKDLADAFLQGYVPPEKLAALEFESKKVKANALPVIDAIAHGKGDIAFDRDGFGLPKILTDSFYPASLIGAIKPYTNEKGMVTSLPEGYKGYIESLIADEASFLQRIKPDIHNL